MNAMENAVDIRYAIGLATLIYINWTRQIDNLLENAFDDATLLGSCQVLCQLKMTYFLCTYYKRTKFKCKETNKKTHINISNTKTQREFDQSIGLKKKNDSVCLENPLTSLH